MYEQEKKEWADDLLKLQELAEAIRVRFDTVVKTGEKGSDRVLQASNIYYELNQIVNELDNRRYYLTGDETI